MHYGPPWTLTQALPTWGARTYKRRLHNIFNPGADLYLWGWTRHACTPSTSRGPLLWSSCTTLHRASETCKAIGGTTPVRHTPDPVQVISLAVQRLALFLLHLPKSVHKHACTWQKRGLLHHLNLTLPSTATTVPVGHDQGAFFVLRVAQS